jgi:DNA-binding MarR family transcriptional regulator
MLTSIRAERQDRQNDIDEKEQRIAALRNAIQLYVGDIKLSKALERQELASLEGIQRHLALSKSLIPSVIRICRLHGRADSRTAVMVIVTLLCDNNDGLCRLSVKRLAQLLARDEGNIRATINSLEKDGLLRVERKEGFPHSYWPNVPAAIATMSPACAWFVDALSEKPAPRGRPRLEAEKTPGADAGGYSEKSRAQSQKTPGAVADSISLGDITKDSKREDASLERSRKVPGEELLEQQSTPAVSRMPTAQKPHYLPSEWTPGAEGLTYALDSGLPVDAIEQQWASFRKHHVGKGSKWACWNTAWQIWVDRAVEYCKRQPVRRSPVSISDLATQEVGEMSCEHS